MELVLSAIVFAPGVSLGAVFGVHKPATSENNRFLIMAIFILHQLQETLWTASSFPINAKDETFEAFNEIL